MANDGNYVLQGNEADDLLNLLNRLEKAGYDFVDFDNRTGEVILKSDDGEREVRAVGLRAAVEAAETVGQVKARWGSGREV